MAKQSKKPADLNRLAAAIVEEATNETPHRESKYAQAGRKGGAKGGKARAAKMPPGERSEIAQRAARARWSASR
jgi:hypothetical protein